ncbi:hypothetical protein TELCIR_11869 [Teladorsagia circumcincta]|uniref:Uncharacterized protein n=1 Tax=Teladorsagia circumcincta TaxID=45464 RepID=A0A2G9U8A6_TELCI|nr:hypothetical protein TELCIR_11869 [Teladorsagia circumcincta]
MVSGRIGGVVAKGKAMQAKRRANKVAPIESKVQARHLELEPLCCLSSCLVRGGCAAVVAFEAFYVLATLLVVVGGMSRGGFTIWEPLPKSWNAWFGHHIFYYCVCAYDATRTNPCVMYIEDTCPATTRSEISVLTRSYYCIVP